MTGPDIAMAGALTVAGLAAGLLSRLAAPIRRVDQVVWSGDVLGLAVGPHGEVGPAAGHLPPN